jgi:hypothetical protein
MAIGNFFWDLEKDVNWHRAAELSKYEAFLSGRGVELDAEAVATARLLENFFMDIATDCAYNSTT